jgi:hypothetical protein
LIAWKQIGCSINTSFKMSITLQRYTERSIVIRGDTKPYIDTIKSVRMAKFGHFGGEPGWMFPLTMETAVRTALKILPPGYVDGPKPNPKSSWESQRVPITAHTGVTSDMVMPHSVVKSTRGSLRGPPIIEDDDEVKGFAPVPTDTPDQTLTMLVAELTSLKQQVTSMNTEITSLKQQVASLNAELTAKLNMIQIEEVPSETL